MHGSIATINSVRSSCTTVSTMIDRDNCKTCVRDTTSPSQPRTQICLVMTTCGWPSLISPVSGGSPVVTAHLASPANGPIIPSSADTTSPEFRNTDTDTFNMPLLRFSITVQYSKLKKGLCNCSDIPINFRWRQLVKDYHILLKETVVTAIRKCQCQN